MLDYRLLSTTERRNEEWNYIEIVRTLEVNYDGESMITSLEKLIENIEETLFAAISDINTLVDPDDMIRVAIANEYLAHNIWVSFKRGSQLTRNVIFNAIYKVCQSKLEFIIDGKLQVDIVIIKMPSGGGHKRKYGVSDLASYERTSSKTIRIEKDGMCCARSLIVGKAIADKKVGYEWRKIKEDIQNTQLNAAKQLCDQAGIQHFSSCGITELRQFQNVLNDYQIIVTDAKSKKQIFIGDEKNISIHLIYGDNHYFPTRSLKAFLGYEYFCNKCLVGFRDKTLHRCDATCIKCFSSPICVENTPKECNDCCREFKSEQCFNNHIANAICNKLKFCTLCCRIYRSKREHICGKFYCSTCHEMVETKNHLCYMSPPSYAKMQKEDSEIKSFIFYDIESCVTLEGAHKPMLLIAQCICSRCNENNNEDCLYCEKKYLEIFGENCVELFCNWLFKDLRASLMKKEKREVAKNPKIFVIAHNGKAYDFHFILKYLNEKQIAGIPNIIKSGSKILSMNYLNVKFLDSVSFLPMPLKALPKAFGFTGAKGWFPHKFNIKENWDYEGNYPCNKYYEPDSMSHADRKDFLAWYESKKDDVFNFRKEIIKYCKLDVEILRKAFMCFRDSFIKETGLDPISRCITIAQACMEVFKVSFLLPKTIAVIPSFGYDSKRKQSIVANIWLSYLEKSNNIEILREKRLGPYFVDGFNSASKTVYEFYGCFFHGCKTCYPTSRHFIISKWQEKTMDQLFERTTKRSEDIKQRGYNLVSIWECYYHQMRKKDKNLNEYHKAQKEFLRSKLPLDPRDAFFGGRTNAVKLFHKISEKEKIRYYDFTSLYPYVIKYCSYPLGHPEIITYDLNDKNTSIDSFNGFVFCTINPPTKLYIPVLPMKIRNKLIFPLCLKCANEINQTACNHSSEERYLTGTWCTPELKKALELGYVIVKIHEVWHFKKFEKFNPETKKGGLFSKFIDKWLKLKVEASGWPKDVVNESQKDAYLKEYEMKEGILLNKENIRKNASLRTQAKLMANSFWGKFAQRPNLPKVCYLNQPSDFFSLLSDPKKIVLDAYLVNNSTMMVQYESIDAFVDDPKHSNIVIAAFTTAYARLVLYETLEILQDRVLYFDTDSIIYLEKDSDDFHLKIGNFLGELTDELEDYGKGTYITKFESGGPKNYAFETFTPSTNEINYCCKIKGITLNYKTKNILTFDAIENLIKSSLVTGRNKELQIQQCVFKLTRENEIMTSDFDKTYRLTYDKRRINTTNYNTLPFGFID